MGINIRESIVENLQKAIDKNDYMTLVSVQLRIKTDFYLNPDIDGISKAKADIKHLTNYKKSYPHIAKEVDEVIDYLHSLVTMNALEGTK